MPEIRGTLSREAGARLAPCVWCVEPTDARAETPGRPDLGEVPLHVWCAGEVVVAYRRLREGKLLTDGAVRLAGFEARLNELDLYREAKLPVPAAPTVEPINATAAEIRYAVAFLDELVPNWRDVVREEEAKRKKGERPADPTRARMQASLEAFGGYTVVSHDDGCPALSGDVAGCRCERQLS